MVEVQIGQVVRVQTKGPKLSDLSVVELAKLYQHPQEFTNHDNGLVGIVYAISKCGLPIAGVWFGEHQPQVICAGYFTSELEVLEGVNRERDLPPHLRGIAMS